MSGPNGGPGAWGADLREAVAWLRGAPGFVAALSLPTAVGTGAAAALLGLFRSEGTFPPALASRLRHEPLPIADWHTGWSPDTLGPAVAAEVDLALAAGLLRGLAWASLAVTCITVAVLARLRSVAARPEDAVRWSVGEAGHRRRRRRAVEVGLPLLVGTAGAAAVSRLGLSWLEASLPPGVEVAAAGWPGLPVLLALSAPLAAGLAFGLVSGRIGSSRQAEAGEGEGTRLLAVAQVAFLVAVLTASALMVQGMDRRHGSLRAYDPADTLMIGVALDEAAPEERSAVLAALLVTTLGAPGVDSGSLASPGAVTGLGTTDRVLAECDCREGAVWLPYVSVAARHHAVGPEFFRTLGVRLLAGREFTEGDIAGAAPVVIVNRTFARRHLRGVDPLSRSLRIGGERRAGAWHAIVGVVEDVRPPGLGSGAEPAPAVYVSALQRPPARVDLLARLAAGAPAGAAAIVEVLEAAAARAGAAVVVPAVTVRSRLERFRAPLGWFGLLVVVGAGLALLLGAHGVHAAAARRVRARVRELGVRRAVGARRRQVALLVLRDAAGTVTLGAVVGIPLAGAASRTLSLGLSGVDGPGLAALGGVVAALAAAAFFGALGPARRAARLDPVRATQEP